MDLSIAAYVAISFLAGWYAGWFMARAYWRPRFQEILDMLKRSEELRR